MSADAQDTTATTASLIIGMQISDGATTARTRGVFGGANNGTTTTTFGLCGDARSTTGPVLSLSMEQQQQRTVLSADAQDTTATTTSFVFVSHGATSTTTKADVVLSSGRTSCFVCSGTPAATTTFCPRRLRSNGYNKKSGCHPCRWHNSENDEG